MAEVLRDEHGGVLDPLATVAGKINALLDKAAKADEKAETYRISAGRELARARERIEAGEAGTTTWTAWCADNIRRSEGDIRKLLAIASSADPTKAAAAERQRNREAVARHRAYVSAVGAKKGIDDVAGATPITINTVKRDIQRLSVDERSVLVDWLIEIVSTDERCAAARLPLTMVPAAAKMVPEETAEPPLVNDGQAASTAVDPPPQSPAPSPEEIHETTKPPETKSDRAKEAPDLTSAKHLEHQEPHSADLPNQTPLQPRPPAPANEVVEPPMPESNPVTEGAAAPADVPSGMPPRTVLTTAATHPEQKPDAPRLSPITPPSYSSVVELPSPPPEPGAAPVLPGPSTLDEGPTGLMSMWEALVGSVKVKTNAWIDRGFNRGEKPSPEVPQSFVDLWSGATDTERMALRAELLRLQNPRWHSPRSQNQGAEGRPTATAVDATPTSAAA